MTNDGPPPTNPGLPPMSGDAAVPAAAAAAPPPLLPPQPGAVPAPTAAPAKLTFTCLSCGSVMAYAPGTTSMKCPSCGNLQQIETHGKTIVEHSYDDWAKLPPKPVATIAKEVLKCDGCGATTETDLIADSCQFCGGVLVAVEEPEGLIVPEAVVPFGLDKPAANAAFGEWVKSRWFAPNALKKIGTTEGLKGTYIPHWTYDANTQTDYTGERGEHYYTTETIPVPDGKGGMRMETQQVQHTRWYPARGHVAHEFNDVVVPASHFLPTEKLDKMGPWTMAAAEPFEPQYLAGYSALRYDVDPDAGLTTAHSEMENVISNDCCADIGGDEQRVSTISVQYAATMFKLMLMPLWIASYFYAGKTFQVLINANTGEVVGARPYSKLKIALAAIAALIVLIVLIALYASSQSSGGS